VAIYLDANLVYSWKTFSELDRVALTIVARQVQQQVVVPQVAAWEGEAHYRRRLEGAAKGLDRAYRTAGDAFRGEDLPALPALEVDEAVERWCDGMAKFASVLPLDPEDAPEAFRREAFGIPPAKRLRNNKGEDDGGTGGRDAAIWLSVLRDAASRDEEAHFISRNRTDFGSTEQLTPALADELQTRGIARFRFYGALEDFLAFLGEPDKQSNITLEEIAQRVPRTLRVVLPVVPDIPRAVFGAEYDWDRFDYFTELKDATPTELLAARRYENEQAITVVNANWELTVDCLRRDRGDEIGPVVGYEDVRVVGSIQCYVPDDQELLPQVVSTRLRVPTLPPPVEGIGG
jgi:hypothetical protein